MPSSVYSLMRFWVLGLTHQSSNFFARSFFTFGHMAGNEVLKKVSAVLERTVGGRDLVCRIGGDEFVLLLSGVEQVEELARRLLWRAQQVGRGEACWTSLSMGGTPVRAGEALEDAIRRADAALYRQKRIGKNGYLLDRDDCM